MDITVIEKQIRKEAASVLWRTILFIAYYILLILLGLGLFFVAFGVTWFLGQGLMDATVGFNLRGLIVIFLAWLAMWWFCIQIAWHLIKPLFRFNSPSDENKVELKQKDCPEFFEMIKDVAKSTQNKMPKHVYLTAEVNACVFYNSTSIWTIFFPTRKNLNVGVGLLLGMNKDEVKAILGHEFGHFSQQSMKVGSISYRLQLIIRDMIAQAQEQQKDAMISDRQFWYFHLAKGPVSFITRKTIDFYNYIERKNRSLSRYMEFEADIVACRSVGAKSFISSLCKLPILSQRYNIYENVIANLITQDQDLKDFWKGYELVYDLLDQDGCSKVSHGVILSSQVGDEALFPSKVVMKDTWQTHPSIKDRIENARQFYDENATADLSDSTSLVPDEIKNAVGYKRQKFIAENLDVVKDWYSVRSIEFDEFKTWTESNVKGHLVPYFLQPFTDKEFIGFSAPTEEEMLQPVESPFNEANRNLLVEFSQGIRDWQTLHQLYSDKTNVKDVMYNGADVKDWQTVIQTHEFYLNQLNEKSYELDVQVYKYLWQRAKNKQRVNMMYWALVTGNEGVRNLGEIVEEIAHIRAQAHLFITNGQSFVLRDDIRIQLCKAFWEYMRSFDFKNVSRICGTWEQKNGSTINQLLDKCGRFVAQETPEHTDIDVFEMVDGIYPLLQQLYNMGHSQYIDRVINAYNNVEENEESETEPVIYEDIWDESLETISEGESIRYHIADYYSNLEHGERFSAEDIFGAHRVTSDEYVEFQKFLTKIMPPTLYESRGDLNEAIAQMEKEPDVQTMNKIAYSYLIGNVVESNPKEAINWFIKSAEMNDAEALDRVGGAYFHGNGVEQNYAKAVEYYKKSIIADGFVDALLNLGLAYLNGDGVPQSNNHGFSLMVRAAKQGQAAAQYNMGYLYEHGVGTEADMEEAIKWYQLSANQNYEQALDRLNRLHTRMDQ